MRYEPAKDRPKIEQGIKENIHRAIKEAGKEISDQKCSDEQEMGLHR